MADKTLSPYDTGARYEPKLWPTTAEKLEDLPPTIREMVEDRYGRVDFDDESGMTGYTVWVERNERGIPVVHVQQTGDEPVAIEIHRGE